MVRFWIILFLGFPAFADVPVLEIKLADAERRALAESALVKAADYGFDAASHRASAQYSLTLPKLTLDANYRYQSQVPSLNVDIPTHPISLPYGAHNNYSVGPTISWVAWDFGGLRDGWKGLQELENSKGDQARLTKKQLLLGVRQNYFKVQLVLEQLRLLSASLDLVSAEHKDIQNRFRAGTASKMDSLSAHRDVLKYSGLLRQAQADLASALHDLFALTGRPTGVDPSLPADEEIVKKPSAQISATLSLKLDPMDASLATLEKKQLERATGPGTSHPQVQMYTHLSEASNRASSSAAAGRWPKLLLEARASYDYPDGPVLQQVQQNLVLASLSMPLLDWGNTSNDIHQKRSEALANEALRDQAQIDLRRDWDKARAQLAGYREQQKIDRESADEAGELSKLVYNSYKAGRSSFLEVQTANSQALDAKIQMTRDQVQTLMQLAALDELSEGE